jgi:serine/threonine protein phosphatase 1
LPRHLAIGDIHGCIKSLTTLVDYVGLRPDDVLITLGDYVNRGPNSRAVLDWLIEFDQRRTLVPLRGNHEVHMVHARTNRAIYDNWIATGGCITLNTYAPSGQHEGSIADVPATHWRFLEERLVSIHEIDGYFFVHASVDPDLPLNGQQPEYLLYWVGYDDPRRHLSGKVMVCGHESQRSGLPITNGNAICIDTAACRGGWLTCLDVETSTFWQANERGQTRILRLDEIESWPNSSNQHS